MRTFHALATSIGLALGAAACGAPMTAPSSDAGGDAAAGPDAVMQPPDDPACRRELVEPDLRIVVGAGDAGTSTPDMPVALPPGSYVVSTTYLRLTAAPDGQQLFRDRMADISAELAHTDGLVAYQLATSTRCVSARTLSVWRDEAAMYRFVGGTAHSAAIAAIGRISRGGSQVTHWADDGTGASLAHATQMLAMHDGPYY